MLIINLIAAMGSSAYKAEAEVAINAIVFDIIKVIPFAKRNR